MEDLHAAGSRELAPPVPERESSERVARVSSRIPRVNLMLVGPIDLVEDLLQTVAAGARMPVVEWRAGQPFALPPAAAAAGTLILRDVDGLPASDQCQLAEWLEVAAGRIQIVSTSATPLIRLVYAGTFLEALYYRLNTIYVDLANGPATIWDR